MENYPYAYHTVAPLYEIWINYDLHETKSFDSLFDEYSASATWTKELVCDPLTSNNMCNNEAK